MKTQRVVCALLPLLLTGHGAHVAEVVARIGGGPLQARAVAHDARCRYGGPVKGFEDLYVLIPLDAHGRRHAHSKRGVGATRTLTDDARVAWAEEQTPRRRQKRDFRPDLAISFNDELWSEEWYLQDTRARPDLPRLDLNVLPLYGYGVTGRGVRVCILDDGIEHTHDDLRRNYDARISYDCNEEDDDPLPRYGGSAADAPNSHGTRCAGEVAMTADNGKCGVGVAYNARVGAVKLLDGVVNDRVEATALSHARHLVDVYSASWGPSDDGRTVDGPGRLAQEALARGVSEGRNGRGSIYVWAAGNGGAQGDNCNCDGYVASPYTIAVGSASQRGAFPWYGEACAATLAVTCSSGARQEQMIATTDLHNECTTRHTGTSASAPLAAGIIALALEVNPALTWRDVQHLVVWTSEAAPLADDPSWARNAAGLWTSARFGFGLMNAFALAAAAANWTTAPPRRTCRAPGTPLRASFQRDAPAAVRVETAACDAVRYVEHVEVQADIAHPVRGAVEVRLTSPQGTRAPLLGARPLDTSAEGFRQWRFMSVMTWGESAAGAWILHVADKVGPAGNRGVVGNVSLILHGTESRPAHMRGGERRSAD